jgi:hypothetical protein
MILAHEKVLGKKKDLNLSDFKLNYLFLPDFYNKSWQQVAKI